MQNAKRRTILSILVGGTSNFLGGEGVGGQKHVENRAFFKNGAPKNRLLGHRRQGSRERNLEWP